jgi:hypothetical protein
VLRQKEFNSSKVLLQSLRHLLSRHLKTFEENIPNGTSNLTMKKEMVHRLSILFVHNMPINYNNMLLSKIVYGKDLPYRRPHKKGHPQRNQSPLNTCPRETKAIITTHDTVE